MAQDHYTRTLPYDYARCMTEDCPLAETCLRKTPGRDFYQTVFSPRPGDDCVYYLSWGDADAN